MEKSVNTGLTYEAFVQLGLALPGVVESTSYGTHALKAKGKLIARLKEDGQTVVLRSGWESREERMAVYPDVFYLTEHYREHPWVLMCLDKASESIAVAAVAHAWQESQPKPKASKSQHRGQRAA